ncbi:MAG TPA: ParB/RepB/Spo0J family partition protein [Terriglobia bacterium]|jgi:ParB family chromosome partitioning protein|nr:ParB/RepB/Spo0J family partition protein [Terriglobia bacterium]
MTRKALGRGLSALIPEPDGPATSAPSPGETAILVGLIDPNPFQPRTHFALEELNELADSVRAQGIIQPVLLRRAGSRYQLVAGERRWRAAQIAGLEAIPAIVRDLDDRESVEIALTENLLRDDLGPIETARAYRTLQERFGLSQEEISRRLGLNRVTVTNTLRLLKLPTPIQEMIERDELTAGHARAILGLPDETDQRRLADRIVKRGLSVREAEKLASSTRPSDAVISEDGTEPKQVDPNVRAAVVELERKLGTRVRITGDGSKGRIEVSYFSADDLNRLYEMIMA